MWEIQSCCTFVLWKYSNVEKPVGWLVELSHALGVQFIVLRLKCSQTSFFVGHGDGQREKVPFIKKVTPRAPTQPSTRKPARLTILI